VQNARPELPCTGSCAEAWAWQVCGYALLLVDSRNDVLAGQAGGSKSGGGQVMAITMGRPVSLENPDLLALIHSTLLYNPFGVPTTLQTDQPVFVSNRKLMRVIKALAAALRTLIFWPACAFSAGLLCLCEQFPLAP